MIKMKKLLITGFEPFGGETLNPSWEAVQLLPDTIRNYRLIKLQIPTVFGEAAQKVLSRAEAVCPDVILSIGQAGGRRAVTPEVVGINLREATIPDNVGNQPQAEPVVADAPAAYFATVPVRDMVKHIKEKELPAALSYSAGAYVCNDVLYSLLHRYAGIQALCGFIHVPYLPEQVAGKENVPSLPLEKIVEALTAAIEALPQ